MLVMISWDRGPVELLQGHLHVERGRHDAAVEAYKSLLGKERPPLLRMAAHESLAQLCLKEGEDQQAAAVVQVCVVYMMYDVQCYSVPRAVGSEYVLHRTSLLSGAESTFRKLDDIPERAYEIANLGTDGMMGGGWEWRVRFRAE